MGFTVDTDNLKRVSRNVSDTKEYRCLVHDDERGAHSLFSAPKLEKEGYTRCHTISGHYSKVQFLEYRLNSFLFEQGECVLGQAALLAGFLMDLQRSILADETDPPVHSTFFHPRLDLS